jgi:hypothetical protein
MSRRRVLTYRTTRDLAEALGLPPDVTLSAVFERRERGLLLLVLDGERFEEVAEFAEAPAVDLEEVVGLRLSDVVPYVFPDGPVILGPCPGCDAWQLELPPASEELSPDELDRILLEHDREEHPGALLALLRARTYG